MITNVFEGIGLALIIFGIGLAGALVIVVVAACLRVAYNLIRYGDPYGPAGNPRKRKPE